MPLSWQIPPPDAYASISLHLTSAKLVAGDLLKLLPVFVEPRKVVAAVGGQVNILKSVQRNQYADRLRPIPHEKDHALSLGIEQTWLR